MSTLTDYRPYHEIQIRVDEVRGRMRSIRMVEGLFLFLTVACGCVLLATLAQGFLRFGSFGRVTLLAAGSAGILAAFWKGIVVPVRYEPSEKETARFVETRLPELGNTLINTLLLTEHADEWSGVLVEHAIHEAASGARGVDLRQAVSFRGAKRRAVAAAAAVLLLGTYVAAAWPRFESAGLQILSPFDRTIASVGAVRFTVTPEGGEWTKGEPMDIQARIVGPVKRDYDGTIRLLGAAAEEPQIAPLVRSAQQRGLYSYHVPKVLQPFRFRLAIGGTESETYTVTLREPPLIERFDVGYTYPDYTDLEPQIVTDSGGEIRCLIGTDVQLTARTTAPVKTGAVLFGSGKVLNCMAGEGGRSLTARFTVLADDTYQVRLEGEGPNGAAVAYRIIALEDEPPVATFTMPRRDVAAAPGERVKLGLKAADRYGLGEVRLMVQAGDAAKPEIVRRWTRFTNPTEAVLDHALEIDPARYTLGQTLTYWAVAADRRTYQGGATPKGPNVVETARYKVLVQDAEKAAREKLRRLGQIYERIREILKAQEAARATTSTLPQQTAVADVRTVGTALAEAQGSIREATLAVIRDVTFDADTMPIRETLQVLAANEMAAAVTKAAAVGALDGAERLAIVSQLARVLAGDQDAIITVLRQILDIVPKLQDAVEEEKKKLAASDLPPEELAKLKALRDKLKEFVEEQKRVIEASKDLAKKPVDDFQEADQQELEKLKAIEDQWDKFMTEAIADFSKVPEVDASNPSLVRELIEVKTDVEMAADALSKKAMDIVVPLEELGMEGAEEIVENLERWLPDTPDRQKWQQEEFTGEAEIPHAELPEQMEDLVGDLLEEEEDLFEEIEDVTSGLGDSLDKGAGWDAMDGPISNFSAKGVTGNRLPNTSEISGRSGEGRTGKSSGEFVEEEATGKGGRRTPTRLSPDAFSKGEVKDTSPEAPTGATGGGKISGAGSEGLEGPVPPEIQRKMGDLAGRQAQLRNKAEGVKAGLAVKNYESFALDDAIDEMRKVQRDLLAGRYENALRRRDVVLENLKNSKMLLGGEIRIRKDASAALPNEIQDEVLDALQKPMPRGYEEYLKQYYERLSELR